MIEIIENESIVPDGANVIYHVVGMKWYNKWLKYVGQEGTEEKHPGPMNVINEAKGEELLDLQTLNDSLMFLREIGNNFHLKSTIKENAQYKVIPHEAWKLLNLRYGTDSIYKAAETNEE